MRLDVNELTNIIIYLQIFRIPVSGYQETTVTQFTTATKEGHISGNVKMFSRSF